MKPALCILGPTASGKTELALRLAQRHRLLLISVDSAMVYRGMDIGTGKPAPQVLQRHPHELVDIRDPTQGFSVGEFLQAIPPLLQRADEEGRIPVFVGGTMLYFDRLFLGLDALPPASPQVRERLREEAARLGWPALHARLADMDPPAAAALLPNDSVRIERALEIRELRRRSPGLEKPPSRPLLQGRYKCLAAALTPDRPGLYREIDQRMDRMLQEGLVEELQKLRDTWGVTAQSPSQRAVGYRQLWPVVEGAQALPQAAESAKKATRTLCRRQFAWLRRMSHSEFHPKIRLLPNPAEAEKSISAFLERG